MAKKNWTDNALGADEATEPDELYDGKADAGESKNYTGIAGDGAAHLASDPKLEAYIKEVASDYEKDYNESWGPQFHGKG